MSKINIYDGFFEEWTDYFFQFILDNINKEWQFYYLSANPNINFKKIKNYPQYEWDIDWAFTNPNIHLKNIFDLPQFYNNKLYLLFGVLE